MTFYFDLIISCACGLLIATMIGVQGMRPGVFANYDGQNDGYYGERMKGEHSKDAVAMREIDMKYCRDVSVSKDGGDVPSMGNGGKDTMTVYRLVQGVQCETTTQLGIIP